jgi:hypothetical protein
MHHNLKVEGMIHVLDLRIIWYLCLSHCFFDGNTIWQGTGWCLQKHSGDGDSNKLFYYFWRIQFYPAKSTLNVNSQEIKNWNITSNKEKGITIIIWLNNIEIYAVPWMKNDRLQRKLKVFKQIKGRYSCPCG